MKRLEITFTGRKPNVPSFFGIGQESDRYVVELHVVPPRVVDNQVVVMHLTFADESVDVVDVPRSGIVSITDNMTRVPGNVTAWLEIMNVAGEEVWHSYTWNMYVGSLPDTLYEMDQMDPTILRRMAAAIQAAEISEEERIEAFSKLNLTVTRINGGVRVEAMNIDGTVTSAVVYDGDAATGEGGTGGSGVDGEDGGYYIPQVTETGLLIFTPTKEGMPSVPSVNIKGNPGKDGEDGFSPVVEVAEIEDGHRISITDAEGMKTFDVMNGSDGQDGYTPVKGVDYMTDEDIAAITDEVSSRIDIQDILNNSDGQVVFNGGGA